VVLATWFGCGQFSTLNDTEARPNLLDPFPETLLPLSYTDTKPIFEHENDINKQTPSESVLS
jgi:hypothetical protein